MEGPARCVREHWSRPVKSSTLTCSFVLFLAVVLTACGSAAPSGVLAYTESKPAKAWAVQAGSSESCWSVDVDTALDGSCVAVGGFDGTAVFGEGQPGETWLEASSVGDAWLARYDEDGRLLWVRAVTGEDYTVIRDVAIAADGTIFVVGFFFGTLELGEGSEAFTTEGWDDGFVAAYEPDGSVRWVRQLSGEWTEECLAATTLMDGSVVVVGLFDSEIASVAGGLDETQLVCEGWLDGFVSNSDALGDVVWARTLTSDPDDVEAYVGPWAVASEYDHGVVVAGDFAGRVSFGPAAEGEGSIQSCEDSMDAFVARFDPDGELRWVRRAGGPEDEQVYGAGCAFDGSVRVTGDFTGSIPFDEGGPKETVLRSEGMRDGFVAAWDADGEFLSGVQVGGEGPDAIYNACVLADGCTIVAGSFHTETVLDPCSTDCVTLETPGSSDLDAFVACIGPDNRIRWARRLGGDADDVGTGIAAHPNGDLVMSGYFQSSEADYGERSEVRLDLGCRGEMDAIVVRVRPDGTL